MKNTKLRKTVALAINVLMVISGLFLVNLGNWFIEGWRGTPPQSAVLVVLKCMAMITGWLLVSGIGVIILLLGIIAGYNTIKKLMR